MGIDLPVMVFGGFWFLAVPLCFHCLLWGSLYWSVEVVWGVFY